MSRPGCRSCLSTPVNRPQPNNLPRVLSPKRLGFNWGYSVVVKRRYAIAIALTTKRWKESIRRLHIICLFILVYIEYSIVYATLNNSVDAVASYIGGGVNITRLYLFHWDSGRYVDQALDKEELWSLSEEKLWPIYRLLSVHTRNPDYWRN